MAMFATTDELGDFLGEELTDARLAKATLVLETATAQIRGWTRQYLEFVADDEITVRGTADRELVLPERPVVEVGDITIGGMTIAPSSYQLHGDTLVRLDGWYSPASIVVLTYSHGFDPIPDDIRGVALQIAARMMSTPPGVRIHQEGVGTYTVSDTYGDASPSDDPMTYLTRYRRRTGSPRLQPEWPGRPYPVANG